MARRDPVGIGRRGNHEGSWKQWKAWAKLEEVP
jgi:hypothetical protein